MGTAVLTDPLLSDESPVGLGTWLNLLAEGDIVPTVFTIGLGPLLGWVVHVALIVAVGRALVLAARQAEPEPVAV
jgi:RsiW-degrading membrane proteinase PrsW (M82 family)